MLKVKTIKKLSVLSYQFLGNYWFSIPLIAFTLNRLSYILFVVLLSVLFLKKYREKEFKKNKSEQSRLRTAVEFNDERKRVFCHL